MCLVFVFSWWYVGGGCGFGVLVSVGDGYVYVGVCCWLFGIVVLLHSCCVYSDLTVWVLWLWLIWYFVCFAGCCDLVLVWLLLVDLWFAWHCLSGCAWC